MNKMMKKWTRLMLALMLAIGVAGCGAAAEEEGAVSIARAVVREVLDGEYQKAEARFSQTLKNGLEAAGGIEGVMAPAAAQMGKVISYGEPVTGSQMGMDVVMIPVTFENMTVSAIVSLSQAGEVEGLYFQPQVAVAEETLSEGVTATEVTVDAGAGYPLGGTLTLPANTGEPAPAVLLIWGSGANGRDEAVGANAVFAQLANGLAEHGIASLRFDKRTHTYPEIMSEKDYSVVDEYMEDVLSAVEMLKSESGIDPDRVFILGHSQGGMLAPRFVDAGADVSGLILLAGTPRHLTDVLYDQELNTLGAGKDDPEARKVFDDMREEARAVYAGTAEEALAHEPLYMGAFPAYYMYEMSRYDAIELIKKHQTPILILQGGNDFQVLAKGDFNLYQDALAGEEYASLKLYPGLNHLFMPSEATTLNEAVAEYNIASRIPEEVVRDIAAFVKAE